MSNRPDTKLFNSIHSEPYPVGNMAGTFYSVMRSVAWLDECLLPLKQPQISDFCIIWHEMHDHELTRTAETLLMNGLLSPVRFIGGHGNSVAILLSSKFRSTCGQVEFQNFEIKIEKVLRETLRRRKDVMLGVFSRSPEWPTDQTDLAGIMPVSEDRASTYLRNIDNLWQLGLKPFTPTPEYNYLAFDRAPPS